MKILLFRLFGHKPITTQLSATTKFKTTVPANRPSFHEWVKQYNVSMLWDRKTIKID